MSFAQGMFQIDPNATPEEIARKRALIAAVSPQYGKARYVGEGLGQLATGIASGVKSRRLDKAEKTGQAEAASLFERILGRGQTVSTSGASGTWTPAAPAPKEMDAPFVSGGNSFGGRPTGDSRAGPDLSFGSATMTPQEMLTAGAEKRGLKPEDVATAISYETGGKFDPMITGPTTQHGQHQGLIQFGKPQAAQHGADFSDPQTAMRSQLDPNNGAVWSYLDGAGVQPGMGLDDIYSAINAGAPGRFNASDANNGGAPGTVADKVAGMGGHRANAAKFMGGTWTPDAGQQTTQQVGAPIEDLYSALANPWLNPQQRSVITSMIQQQQQNADPMRQLQLAQARADLQKSQGVGGGNEYGLNPQFGVDANGAPVLIQIGKNGQAVQTKMPDGVSLSKEPIKIDAGTHWILLDPISRQPVGQIPKNNEQAAAETATGSVTGKAQGEAAAALGSMSSKMPGLEEVVLKLEALSDDATYTAAGRTVDSAARQLGLPPRDSAVARSEYIAIVDNQVLPLLRDTFGAAFTEREGATLRATLGDPNKSPSEKKAVLRAFIEQKRRNIEATAAQVNGTPQDQGWTEMPGGVKIRVRQ